MAYGPLGQGEFLGRLGIAQRLRRLLQNASPEQRTALESGCDRRLVSLDAMGRLFKVLALTAGGGPVPPGFGEHERRRWLGSQALGGLHGVRHGFFGRLGA